MKCVLNTMTVSLYMIVSQMGKLDFTKSCRKKWSLIWHLGEAQDPPKTTHPPVRANAVAVHLIKLARAPTDKYKWKVQNEWRYILCHGPDKEPASLFHSRRMSCSSRHESWMALGYDLVHTELLKNFRPKAQTWLAQFFSRKPSRKQSSKTLEKGKS